MAQPVVHFEIIGNDPQNLRDYYTGLFGWEFDTPSPVAEEVSEPGSYGFLDLVTSEDGTGIRGGVEGGPSYKSHAVFYVASRMSRPHCSERRSSEALGSWVQRPHRVVSSSVTSRIPRAP